MYASPHRHIHSHSEFFRDAAAACGGTLVACWIALVTAEAVRSGHFVPNVHSFPQAIVLAVMFASYLLAWRHALVGAAVAIVGTIVFFVVGFNSTGIVPPLPAAMLAVPGVLSLMAWKFQDKHSGAH
jgi:uncharacterized membrane protein